METYCELSVLSNHSSFHLTNFFKLDTESIHSHFFLQDTLPLSRDPATPGLHFPVLEQTVIPMIDLLYNT